MGLTWSIGIERVWWMMIGVPGKHVSFLGLVLGVPLWSSETVANFAYLSTMTLRQCRGQPEPNQPDTTPRVQTPDENR